MKSILREPLLHFLLIGALLFLVYSLLNTEESKNNIAIDQGVVNELIAKWKLTTDQNPALNDIKELVTEYIEQEVLYREALLMGLDKDDDAIKQLLAQKMLLLSGDLGKSLQPDEETLKMYFDQNRENYKRTSLYSFEQVFFDDTKRLNALEDAEDALNSSNPQGLGDSSLFVSKFMNADLNELEKDFGMSFTKALDTIDLNKWSGPIHSVFGVHLVYISGKKANGYYEYKDILKQISLDYSRDATNYYKREFIAFLLRDYTIDFDLKNIELKKVLDEAY